MDASGVIDLTEDEDIIETARNVINSTVNNGPNNATLAHAAPNQILTSCNHQSTSQNLPNRGSHSLGNSTVSSSNGVNRTSRVGIVNITTYSPSKVNSTLHSHTSPNRSSIGLNGSIKPTFPAQKSLNGTSDHPIHNKGKRFKIVPLRSETNVSNNSHTACTYESRNRGRLVPVLKNTEPVSRFHLQSIRMIPFYDYFYSEETESCFNSVKQMLEVDTFKTEFRIQCTLCKDSFTNDALISHLIRHFRSHLCVTADSSCLTQCLYCLRDIETPFKLQVHHARCLVDKNPADHRECLICEQDFINDLDMANHLQDNHRPRDMPYNCPVCFSYRTSFYQKFQEHFVEFHSNTNHLYCPYCLKHFIVPVSSVSSSKPKLPRNFLSHLKLHIDGPNLACSSCRLVFLHSSELKKHRIFRHRGRSFVAKSLFTQRSLNVNRAHFDLEKVRFRIDVPNKRQWCLDCGEKFISFRRHFKKYIRCGQCRFGTCCLNAWMRHRRVYHDRKIPEHRAVMEAAAFLPDVHQDLMRCPCGLQTSRGNFMAEHMLVCDYSHVVVGPRCASVRDPNTVVLKRKRLRPGVPEDIKQAAKEDFLKNFGLLPCRRKTKS